jgi:signal transduction histidine kinase
MLSHDLRTPLTAAKMSAELLRRRVADDPVPTLTTRIVDNLNRANAMIEDLLDASKLRAGGSI